MITTYFLKIVKMVNTLDADIDHTVLFQRFPEIIESNRIDRYVKYCEREVTSRMQRQLNRIYTEYVSNQHEDEVSSNIQPDETESMPELDIEVDMQ